jgi:hypothetical protein
MLAGLHVPEWQEGTVITLSSRICPNCCSGPTTRSIVDQQFRVGLAKNNVFMVDFWRVSPMTGTERDVTSQFGTDLQLSVIGRNCGHVRGAGSSYQKANPLCQ